MVLMLCLSQTLPKTYYESATNYYLGCYLLVLSCLETVIVFCKSGQLHIKIYSQLIWCCFVLMPFAQFTKNLSTHQRPITIWLATIGFSAFDFMPLCLYAFMPLCLYG